MLCQNSLVITNVNVPDTETAVLEYEIRQGQLTHFSSFGIDPLDERPDLIIKRAELFYLQGFTYESMFTDIVSSNGQKFRDGVLYFGEITNRLVQFINNQ